MIIRIDTSEVHQLVDDMRRHADDTPARFYLAGRYAVAYKETVSSSPWTTYRLLKVLPALGAATWRRGGRSTR